MKVYIAGPMTGIPFFNFPAFDEAAARFRTAGWEVVSPADMDREHGFDAMKGGTMPWTLRECLEWDIVALLKCDSIALLPGWHNSKGAKAELAVAHAIGLEVLDANTMEWMNGN